MPLAQCPRCNKMFNKTESLVCQACDPAETADYKKVRDALEASPGLNTEEAAEAAEVAIAVVKRMLKDGVLALKREEVGILCTNCRTAPALNMSRRLCQACLDKLNKDMAQAQASIKQAPVGPTPPNEIISVRRALEERGKR